MFKGQEEDPDARQAHPDPRHRERRQADKTIAGVAGRCCPRPTVNDRLGAARRQRRPSRWAMSRSAPSRRALWRRRSTAASQPRAARRGAGGRRRQAVRRSTSTRRSTPSRPTPARSCGPPTLADEAKPQHARARFGGGVSYRRRQGLSPPTAWATSSRSTPATASIAVARQAGRRRCAARRPIANGSVYVLSQDNQLFALSQADGKVAVDRSGTLETQGVFGVAAPAVSQGTVVAGFSSGELNAYRYENGRALWQDALSRTAISTSVSSAGRHRCRSGDRPRHASMRSGRAAAWSRSRSITGPAAVGAEFRRHLDAVGRGRMGVRRHRRCAAGLPGARDRQGALDQPAAAHEQQTRRHVKKARGRSGHLVRPGAGGRPAGADQFARARSSSASADRRHGRARRSSTRTPFTLPPIVANSTLYIARHRRAGSPPIR